MKIALFGGTFDPIHTAHLRMAGMLADALSLDTVLFMPTFVPPHKAKGEIAPAEHRLQMCKLATTHDSRFTVSDMEIQRGGASFTVDTLRELQTIYPDAALYLFVGADMFMTLGTWYCAEEILRMVTVCTVPRDDVSAETLRKHGETLGGKWYVAEQAVGDISSTEIRARIGKKQSLAGLVPNEVAEYISANGLYTGQSDDAQKQLERQLIEIIRKRESDYRFLHSLEVAKSAETLATRYGADLHKARVAGLLHDVMKDVSAAEQLQILKDFGILLTDIEKNAPKLWHAMAGAAFTEHILGICDHEIVNAIRYHTTARAGMSLLEKVIFIADFISADRTYPDVEEMRTRAKISLESAMEYALLYTVRDLEEKGAAVHPDTTAALNEILTGGNDDGKR